MAGHGAMRGEWQGMSHEGGMAGHGAVRGEWQGMEP